MKIEQPGRISVAMSTDMKTRIACQMKSDGFLTFKHWIHVLAEGYINQDSNIMAFIESWQSNNSVYNKPTLAKIRRLREEGQIGAHMLGITEEDMSFFFDEVADMWGTEEEELIKDDFGDLESLSETFDIDDLK